MTYTLVMLNYPLVSE